MNAKTGSIISLVFGGLLIFYLIGSTFSDMGSTMYNNVLENGSINSTHPKGTAIVILLPLVFAVGLLYGLYKIFKG